jgi:nitrogen fixation NifU-like protein
MTALDELYQEIIIDHARSPKNFGLLSEKSHSASGHNPLCGDIIRIDLLIKNDHIEEISFSGDGCAISKASASLMTESLKGKSLASAQDLFQQFHGMLVANEEPKSIGKLAILSGVKEFPVRVKCATLAWHTFNAALAGSTLAVTTE